MANFVYFVLPFKANGIGKKVMWDKCHIRNLNWEIGGAGSAGKAILPVGRKVYKKRKRTDIVFNFQIVYSVVTTVIKNSASGLKAKSRQVSLFPGRIAER